MELIKCGVLGEKLSWKLVSEHSISDEVHCTFEARPNCFDRVYHAETITSDRLESIHYSLW